MSDGQVLKPDKDFSKDVDKQLPEAQELAKVYTQAAVNWDQVVDWRLLDKCTSSYREVDRAGEANKAGKRYLHTKHSRQF